ncbi:hypothetical protein JTB14_029775 [Gonioctena quinquepunctata]|nr:hypothetical protein JTB14_029775 [Gonioctena quinquepunctata]
MIPKSVQEQARLMNLKFNQNKVQYKFEEVKCLGFIFNKDGMSVDPIRVGAIKSSESPSNAKDLQKIMGALNYLRSFIPYFADITAPLEE